VHLYAKFTENKLRHINNDGPAADFLTGIIKFRAHSKIYSPVHP